MNRTFLAIGILCANKHPAGAWLHAFPLSLIAAAALACVGPSSTAKAEPPPASNAQAKLDFDFGVDWEDVMEAAQEQIEAAREQVAEATAEARKFAQADMEEARKSASEQMEAARKQLEEARRQWQKQMEEARTQMRLAARSIRLVSRRERLTAELSRMGIVAKAPEGSASGIVVQAVTPGSPGEKAGIAAGDVLTSINGERLQLAPDGGSDDEAVSRVSRMLRHVRRGQAIEVEYRRGNGVRKANLVPESHQHYAFGEDTSAVRSLQLPGGWLSLELAEINPALGEYFGTSRGLLVLRASTSPDVALKAGDVILKIGEEEPSTPRQAVRLLRSYEPGQSIPVEIVRQKKKQTLALQIPRSPAERQ